MLTHENKKAIDNLFDKATPFKGWLEIVLDLAVPFGTSQLDKLMDKIKPEYHNIINEVITHLLIDLDYEAGKTKLAILLAEIIDTPLVDGTPEENESYKNVLDLIQTIIFGLIAKKDKLIV